MTDSSSDPQSVGQEPFITIPVSLLHRVRELNLTGTQYALWLYLYELDPYGQKWVDVPPPAEIAQALKVDTRTIQRCAQWLADCELFDFEIKRWKARNTMASVPSVDFSTGKGIHLRTKRSKCRQMDQKIQKGTNTQSPKPSQVKGSRNGTCTNNKKNLKNNKNSPAHHPVFVGNGQEGDLVQASNSSELLEIVVNAGISPNKTIQRAIAELRESKSPADARQAVENAVSAVLEQISGGSVKNPGGLMVTALRQGFTANYAKQAVRERRDPPPTPPDPIALSSAIDHALRQGDRTFALQRLQQVWDEGWRDEIHELCHILRHDWGFCAVPDTGVRDKGASDD